MFFLPNSEKNRHRYFHPKILYEDWIEPRGKSRGSSLFFKIIISFTEILKENKENKKKSEKKFEKIVEFKFD